MITIEKAAPADAPLLTEIAVVSFITLHEKGMPAADLAYYLSTKLTPAVIEEELSHPENIFHIIYYNEKPAGYSKIIFNSSFHATDGPAVTKMERLYLLNEFHGLKLGAVLFEHNVHLSRQASQQGMWLFVWTKNEHAIGFYKKQGFEIIGSADFKISENLSNPNHIMYLKY